MKSFLQRVGPFCLLACLGFCGQAVAQTVFINEIHYDNASTDAGEAIEVAGPAGTDLTGWNLVLYNGNNGAPYTTSALSGVLADQGGGYGFAVVTYATDGIQNGAPDAVALVNAAGAVVQFLSYEGVFMAVGGPADGLTSTDIGVSEGNTTPAGHSLQLSGTGNGYADFTWAPEAQSTFGAVNTNQTLGSGGGPAPDPDPEPDPQPEPATVLVFINEIHYDNAGGDMGEGVEVAGLAGTDLAGWQLVPYNGSGGVFYSATTLSGTIPNQQNGFGTVFFPIVGLQNGAPDGIALVDAAGTVLQFLSYEGTFAATNGPAAGTTSTDIGVDQEGGAPSGLTMQLTGTGSYYTDFTWTAAVPASSNAVNHDQVFLPLRDIVFINEIHYDNASTDTGEGIEIAGRAGTDLTGWSLVLYNGLNGAVYNTQVLSGTIPNQSNGFGFVHIPYPVNGIQNGDPDGVALVNADGEVVQFLSYEGSFTAVGGPADGLTSTDIGVAELTSTPVGQSLQLTGLGFTYDDFTWSGPTSNTFGAINAGQDFGGGTTDPEPQEPQEVAIAEARALPLGTPVIVNGTLTVADELGGPAFIQDATGGIALFSFEVHGPGAFSIGDSLQVTAVIGAFNEQVQLVEATEVTTFGPATSPIEPVRINVAQLNASVEGQLVTIPDASFADTRGLLFPESNFNITDGTGTAQLRIDGDVESLVGRLKPQTAVDITGVVGSFRGTLQILPRFAADVPGTAPYVAAGSDRPISTTLDVMTWNIAFFGSTLATFGPSDVRLQLQNAARLIDSVHADVIAVQEISDDQLLQELADMLPGYQVLCSDRFSYSFDGPDPTFPEQKLCFLYNTNVITVIDDRVLFEEMYDAARAGASTPLDAYPTSPSSFWSSGRLPYMLTVDATVDGVTERVQVINIHAKSGSASADLIRRRFDVQALKDTLDRYYPAANIILLGDYNDDVDVSIGGGPSTYSTFVEAPDFGVVTSTLSESGLRSFITQDNVIDHITISNELYDDHLIGSETLVIPFNLIPNYANTTSDHLPVLTRFLLTEPLAGSAGPDQTVYVGYAPMASTTLTAAGATGGTAPYTYTWSDGQTGQSIGVCPTQPTVYTLTITDALGRTYTDEVQVQAINVSCGDNPANAKVQLCHQPSGKPGKESTLCVSADAVADHLANGARLGSCAWSVASAQGQAEARGLRPSASTGLKAYPNPIADNLTLEVGEALQGKVDVVLYDMVGAVVYRQLRPVVQGRAVLDLRDAHLPQGMYLLQVSHATGSHTIRIMKK